MNIHTPDLFSKVISHSCQRIKCFYYQAFNKHGVLLACPLLFFNIMVKKIRNPGMEKSWGSIKDAKENLIVLGRRRYL